MPFSRRWEKALEEAERAVAAGRLPHGLLVRGHPRGEGGAFAERLLKSVFGLREASETRQHVDIHWLEPQGKGRVFPSSKDDDVIRPELLFLSQSSFSGGWKAVVFLFADRLNATGQNRLLKTLEEPSPNSLILLVTDSPESLLATVRSRLQKIDVQDESGWGDAEWAGQVTELLRNPPPPKPIEMFAWADALAVPLREMKERAEEEEAEAEAERAAAEGREEARGSDKSVAEGRVATRVKELREEWFRVVLAWQRDVLAAVCGRTEGGQFPGEEEAIARQAAKLTQAEAEARIAAVEKARELLEHNIRESVALPRLARALALPEGR